MCCETDNMRGLLVLFVVLACVYRYTEACSCLPQHPQVQFCGSDFGRFLLFITFTFSNTGFIHWIRLISLTGCHFLTVKTTNSFFHNVKITSGCDLIIFHIFSKTQQWWKYQKSCLTREINSTFNVKPLNILYVHISQWM